MGRIADNNCRDFKKGRSPFDCPSLIALIINCPINFFINMAPPQLISVFDRGSTISLINYINNEKSEHLTIDNYFKLLASYPFFPHPTLSPKGRGIKGEGNSPLHTSCFLLRDSQTDKPAFSNF